MEKKDYTVTELEVKEVDASSFVSGEYDSDILGRMRKIILTEAPIREALLFKRTLNSYSLYKNGSRLNEYLLSLVQSLDCTVTTESDGERVYHRENDDSYFRPTPNAEVRYSYQIPHGEAANAVLYILGKSEKSSYTKSELLRLFISELGYLKSGDKIEALFDAALKDGRIKRSGNGRILK